MQQERILSEAVIDESRRIANRYLDRAKTLEDNGGIIQALGLSDDLGPVFIGACARTMLHYDINEAVESLNAAPDPAVLNSKWARFKSSAKKERNVLLMDYAAQILKAGETSYLEHVFGETIPPELKHIDFAARELFAILHVSVTNPHLDIPVQERFETWAGNWRARMSLGG